MKIVLKLGLFVIFWFLTLNVGGWLFWICLVVSVFASYWVIGRFIYYYGTPWRRIYFPLINRYAYLSGAHLEMAKQTGIEFSPLNPLLILLKDYLPKTKETQLQEALHKWKEEFDSFQCQSILHELLSRKGNKPEWVREKIEEIRMMILEPDNYNGFLVRYIIGEVIEDKIGREQKGKYWEAILSRKIV